MKKWLSAFRLRTLPLSLSCILVGSFSALFVGEIDWYIFGLAIMTTIFLQVLSNLANDYGDSKNGADHDGREGPSRAVQTGAISLKAMKRGMLIFALLSLITGLSLIKIALADLAITYSLFFIALGFGAIAAAIKYTAGNNPYGYRALGDLFVFLFFGIIGVCGTYYLQTKSFSYLLLLPASSIGLFSVAVMNLNNMRDIISDVQAGKKTVASMLGEDARRYHLILLLTGMGTMLFYLYQMNVTLIQYCVIIAFPIFIRNGLTVIKVEHLKDLDPELKKVALGTFLLAVLYAVSFFLV